MALNINCPLPAALAAIPESTCPEIFGQIQKIAFQIIQTTPSFTSTTIGLKATWTAAIAESDATKIVVSPFIMNLIVPETSLASEGGNDNTTINGIRNVRGLQTATATGNIVNVSAATRAGLQALFAYSKAPMPGLTQLWAYPILHDGRVLSYADLSGIQIYNVALTDPKLEGFNKDNVYPFSFDLLGGWSDGLVANTTNFKPYQLVNA